jgi:hypothetical protein
MRGVNGKNLNKKEGLENIGIGRSIILKCILKSRMGRRGVDCCGLGEGPLVGPCKKITNFTPYKLRGIYCLWNELLATQEDIKT